MNKFELFTMIYFALEAYYEDSVMDNEQYLTVLSDMNPFVWNDLGSADPTEYSKFCSFVEKKQITLDNSLEIAKEYVRTISFTDITAAFDAITPEEWQSACKEYLSSEHKGQDNKL